MSFMWFLFGDVSSFSGCMEWATEFNCCTPWAFHIIILEVLQTLTVFLKNKISAQLNTKKIFQ